MLQHNHLCTLFTVASLLQSIVIPSSASTMFPERPIIFQLCLPNCHSDFLLSQSARTRRTPKACLARRGFLSSACVLMRCANGAGLLVAFPARMDPGRFDAALATLASVFEDIEPEALLSALEAAEGDVERATDDLLSGTVGGGGYTAIEPSAKRRKTASTANGLVGWLGRSQAPSPSEQTPPPAHKTVPVSSVSKSAGSPARNLNDVLRADGEETAVKGSGLPPMTLATPQMVVQHLPCCSLILDVLPKELASLLYVQMVDDSLGKPVEGGSETPWPRNKWWLNDRLVESTHSTTFFVSADQDGDGTSYNEVLPCLVYSSRLG